MLKIVEMTTLNIGDINKANQPFNIIGRLQLSIENGKWNYNEIADEAVVRKQYPNYDGQTPDDYISSNERIVYLAYSEEKCVGQILLAKSWNGYIHIEDISVAEAFRGSGVGTMLLKKAYEYAKANGISALSIECQSNNVLASRFLIKNGFEIGGVNTRLYSMLGPLYESETAVFWYKNL